MKILPTGLIAIALATLIVGPAHALDQTILGAGFQVKNPGDPAKRKVQVKAKENPSPNTIVGNPVTGGATLTIRANGTSPTQQVIALPQGMNAKGKPFWSGDAVKGFKYNDAKFEQGPVKGVKIKKTGGGVFQIQAQLSSKTAAVTILPPNLGTDACVLLQLGGGDSYSIKFTGGTVVNKGDKEYSHKKVATEGTCAPTCSDGIQNQGETDLDCGGPNCAGCANGDSCFVPADCASGICSFGICQAPSCTDLIKNGSETDIDCGGLCPNDCGLNQGCAAASDCQTGLCSGALCKCPNQLYTFTVNSNTGGLIDSAEWPGGTASQNAVPSCGVTINRPNDNINLVCTLATAFSVNTFTGYSNCFGTGGEDGDGCQPVSCPPLGIGSCCSGRPSCSAALNGSGTSQYFVQCLQ